MIKDLNFVSPESEGISSQSILEFIKKVEYYKINMHSFMIARNGNVVAECYAKPFDKDFAHRIYSSSKTFVAMAVGLAITEGKIKLTDKIVDLLGRYIHTDTHRWLRDTTVHDALTMSLGHLGNVNTPENPSAWITNNMNEPKFYCPPGTRFLYNTGADLMAAAIKEVTGKEFLDYLRPIFDKLGISKDVWCVKNAEGTSWGGSGIVITLRDFAKFGELVLNRGLINGEQLIDREYMELATSVRVFNAYENNYTPLKSGGYGYLLWITPEASCFRGMGLQQCYCFHDKNLMFVCQGDSQTPGGVDYHDSIVYDLFKFLIYDRITDAKGTEECSDSYPALKEKLDMGIERPMFGKKYVPYQETINRKVYFLPTEDNENPLGWKWFRFDFGDGEGVLTYENRRGIKQISFGMGYFKNGKFPETHYYDRQNTVPANRELDCEAVAEWVEDQKLLLRTNVTDTAFGNFFAQFSFKGDEVTLFFRKVAEFFLDDYDGTAWAKLSE